MPLKRLVIKAFSERDLKELSRLVGKYGRKRVAAKLKTIPLPAGRGRPRKSPEELSELTEFNEDMAEAVFTWANEYDEAGRTNPVELAFIDLYELLQPKQSYRTWRKTTDRKLGPVRRYVAARLKEAQQTADRIAAFKAEIKKESAKKSRE